MRAGRQGGVGAPRTLAAAQRRPGSGSPSSFHLPPGTVREKWLTAHLCPLLAEERVSLSRRLILCGETGGGSAPGIGVHARPRRGSPSTVEVPACGWGPCGGRGPCRGWRFHPQLGVLARDGICARGPAPRHPRWAPAEFLWSHPVAWGHPGWATAARGLAIKLRWISFEFRTFKFSSSYVSGAGRTSGLGRPT